MARVVFGLHLDVEQPSIQRILETATRSAPKIGDLQKIRKNEVSVETQKWIAIEEYGVDAADDHQIQADAVQPTGLAVPPDNGGPRSDKELDQDAGGSNRYAFPLALDHPCIRSITIHARREQQKHDANLVAFRPPFPASERMAKLMQDLGSSQAK